MLVSAPAAPSASAQAEAAPPPDGNDERLAPSLATPDAASLAGANETAALLEFESSPDRPGFFGVVDLASGCIGETRPGFRELSAVVTRVITIGGPSAQPEPEPVDGLGALHSEAGRAEIADTVALLRRFGARWAGLGALLSIDLAGRTIAFGGAETLYRSLDGGSTFEVADKQAAEVSNFDVSPDGRFLVFSRCVARCQRYQLVVSDRGGPNRLRGQTEANGPFAIDPDSKYAYVERHVGGTRTGAWHQLCIDRIPLAGGATKTLRCFRSVELPPQPQPPGSGAPGAPEGDADAADAPDARRAAGAPTRGRPGPKAVRAEPVYEPASFAGRSRGAAFAAVFVPTTEPNRPRLEIISLRDGRSVDGIYAAHSAPYVDDRGVTAFHGEPAGAAPNRGGGGEPAHDTRVFVLSGGRSREVARGAVIGWAPGGRLLVFDKAAAAARARCGIVKIVHVPSP